MQPNAEPRLFLLFLVCAKVGFLSFGGGLVGWLHHEFVSSRGWVNDKDFSSTLAICQMLPGSNIVNLVLCLGDELRGLPGAAICVFGFLLGPFLTVIGLSVLFDILSDASWLQAASSAVAFAALGLVLVICIRGVRVAAKHLPSLAIVGILAIGVGIFHWPILLMVLVTAPISIFLAWRSL